MREAVEQYLRAMGGIHATGAAVKETSYYPALAELINAIGAKLNPKVRFVSQVRNTGAGIPDAGLFTAEQMRAVGDADVPVQAPARGVMEIKPPTDDVLAIAASAQVRRYAGHYGEVLVTNYRDFVIVDRDHAGQIVTGERFTLAKSANEFWAMTRSPGKVPDQTATLLVEYLQRSLIRGVSLTRPRDVASLLASYARDVRARLEAHSLGGLIRVRQALESNLGLRFEAERGEHFFRSTVVQTLFYGIFSAWVLWSRGERIGAEDREAFDWRLAGWGRSDVETNLSFGDRKSVV